MVKAREAKSWKLVSPDMTSEEEAEGDDLCVTDPVGDLQPSIDFLRSSKIVIRANTRRRWQNQDGMATPSKEKRLLAFLHGCSTRQNLY